MSPPLTSLGRRLSVYRRALNEARPYWRLILLVLLNGFIGIGLGLLHPWTVRIVVDGGLSVQPLPWQVSKMIEGLGDDGILLAAICIGGLLALVQAAWSFGDWMLREWVSERMVLDYRIKLFEHGLSLSLDREGQGTFDAVQRISQDAPAIS